MQFAHLKRILKLGRLRLRGPRGAQDEFLLAATAQNLRRLAKLRPIPPPTSNQHDGTMPISRCRASMIIATERPGGTEKVRF